MSSGQASGSVYPGLHRAVDRDSDGLDSFSNFCCVFSTHRAAHNGLFIRTREIAKHANDPFVQRHILPHEPHHHDVHTGIFKQRFDPHLVVLAIRRCGDINRVLGNVERRESLLQCLGFEHIQTLNDRTGPVANHANSVAGCFWTHHQRFCDGAHLFKAIRCNDSCLS